MRASCATRNLGQEPSLDFDSQLVGDEIGDLDFPFGGNVSEGRKRDHKVEWDRRKHKGAEMAEALRKLMGGKCLKCGGKRDLEFHHPYGRNWEPRRMNMIQRMRRYIKDWEAGKLGLLCSGCNGEDGAMRGFWQRAKARRRKLARNRARRRRDRQQRNRKH